MNRKGNVHLSVVAVSRNDDHGKNLLYRMNQFVNAFIQQANRHQIISELILVEWNPLNNKEKLADVLSVPMDLGCCSLRFIEFSAELHNLVENSNKIPLFQMIGKNVGIRRAKGSFVLASNIDIVFSDNIMKFLKNNLKKGVLYRADRFDVPEIIPDAGQMDEMLAFCRKNVLRINTINGTYKKEKVFDRISNKILNFNEILKNGSIKILDLPVFVFLFLKSKFLRLMHCFKVFSLKKMFFYLQRKFFGFCRLFIWNRKSTIREINLHTNACGDFTLLSKEDWNSLKGYPEWPIFSWHLDSVFMYQAYQHKLKFKNLPPKMAIYHIDHEIGSGYSEEGASLLFKRLDDRGIPYLSNDDLDALRDSLLKSKDKVIYNDDDWGFNKLKLPETCFSGTSNVVL